MAIYEKIVFGYRLLFSISNFETWMKQFNGFECGDVTSSQMLKYATVCTRYFINGTRKGATHMCQIVGIPSHSRVELQLILQDTKNYLYHKTTAWNTCNEEMVLVRIDKNISFYSKIVILKMEQGNEHLWTHVEFLRHLTLIYTVIFLQKW